MQKLINYCTDHGIFYEYRDKGPNESESLLAARQWEILRRGAKLGPRIIEGIFKFLPSRLVTKKRLETNATELSLADLKQQHGLLTDAVWHEALLLIPLEEREYYMSMLRRGEKLQNRPRVRLSTIHGAKGGEATNVALFTDLTGKTFRAMQKNPDDETRVFYVGATRAKENLHVMSPQTMQYYQL